MARARQHDPRGGGVIPSDFIVEWRASTRWATDEQVEQDLVLCRALVEIFEDTELANDVALRGGTALHKLHFSPARRYSEDIDLVQLRRAPIGPTIDRIRAKLDRWLGEPKRERGEGMRLIYRFESENPPVVRLRLKIETNTREHLAVRGTTKRPFSVESRWWQGRANITTFEIGSFWLPSCGRSFSGRRDATFSTCGLASRRVSIHPPWSTSSAST